jgi:tetratricopeptide (TPR) repeat protein
MPAWQFRTLGSAELAGRDRVVAVDDPLLVAFLAVLAVEGDGGIAAADLQLLLTPEAKRDAARRELARLVAGARDLLGETAIVVGGDERYALAPDALSLDVDVFPQAREMECADFLRGVPLPDGPEFRDWLAATRRRVAPRTNTPSSTVRPRNRASLRSTAIAAFIVIVVAGAGYRAFARPATGFVAGDVVMVADVANHTRDTVFDQGMLTAATVALRQSARVSLYPRSRLAAIYRLMKLDATGTALDYELAQDVAERDHVRWVLGLSISRGADGYHVGARVADVRRHLEVADVNATAPAKNDVLGTLDRVLVGVRRKLAESPWDVQARHRPLPLVTTASLEALRSYAEGSTAWSGQRYDHAGELWRRAVDLDTGFAMAYGALGSWYYYHHDRATGQHYYDEALKRSDRLTEWERLRLLEGQAAYRGNTDSALVLSRKMSERFPGVTSSYNYGVTLMQAGRREEAIVAYRRALAFDSLHVNSWINLATSAKGLGRYDEAVSFYERAGNIDSAALYSANINGEYGGTLIRVGRIADAEAVFRRMAAADRVTDRMLGQRSLGWLALAQGRLVEAIDAFQLSLAAAQQANNTLGEGRNHILLASVFRTANRPVEANAEITRALALDKSPVFEPSLLAVLVYACQQLDRPRDAEAVAALLHERVNPDSREDKGAEAYANGVLQLIRHRPDSALLYFRQATDFPVAVQRLMGKAEAFQALGQRDSTRVALETLVDSGGFGGQGQDDWLRAPLLLGDVLLASGDSAGAVKRYQEVIARWRDAPADFPDLVTARARLSALTAARR